MRKEDDDKLIRPIKKGNDKLVKVADDLKQYEDDTSEEDAINRLEKIIIEYDLNFIKRTTEGDAAQDAHTNINTLSPNDEYFLRNDPYILRNKLEKEVFSNPKLLPKLSGLDYSLIGIAGTIATIVDFLVVRIPKDIKYLNKFQQEGSSITKWLRTIGVDEEGELKGFFKWVEKNAKVPYDLTSHPDVKGLYTRTHRLQSLAHDPVFGLIFGVIDIIFGQMTTIDSAGKVIIVKTVDPSFKQAVFSPLLWIAHIVSDICTRQGIPVPGWAFSQMLQIGDFGTKHRTIAGLSRWMYIYGYDLRHYLTMTTSVAVVEIIVRAYHMLTSIKKEEDIEIGLIPIYLKELKRTENNLKLHKMLFLSHSFASAGNVTKVIAYQGNPLAINIAQWARLIDESINILSAVTRDKSAEKVIRNREKIKDEWDNIKSMPINKT